MSVQSRPLSRQSCQLVRARGDLTSRGLAAPTKCPASHSYALRTSSTTVPMLLLPSRGACPAPPCSVAGCTAPRSMSCHCVGDNGVARACGRSCGLRQPLASLSVYPSTCWCSTSQAQCMHVRYIVGDALYKSSPESVFLESSICNSFAQFQASRQQKNIKTGAVVPQGCRLAAAGSPLPAAPGSPGPSSAAWGTGAPAHPPLSSAAPAAAQSLAGSNTTHTTADSCTCFHESSHASGCSWVKGLLKSVLQEH